MKINSVTIIRVIGGVFANLQSPDCGRWAAILFTLIAWLMSSRNCDQMKKGLPFLLIIVLSFTVGCFRSQEKPSLGTTSVRSTDGMVMVYVPAGAFLMGSDKAIDPDAYDNELPQHSVNLDAFWIDETEVTNAQYHKCVQAGVCQPPSFANDPNFNADNQPVVSVSWYDAKAYCQWAGADLPTEAQWEKAARSTDGRIYPWGNQPATCEYAVMGENLSNGCGKGNAAWPVGSKPKGASPYGVLDMSGNVLEWVEDWYEGYPDTPYQSDWFGTRVKVVRGGCWSVGHPHTRAAARSGRYPDARGYLGSTVGFRCVAAVQRG